jgi:hypothetical protein
MQTFSMEQVRIPLRFCCGIGKKALPKLFQALRTSKMENRILMCCKSYNNPEFTFS